MGHWNTKCKCQRHVIAAIDFFIISFRKTKDAIYIFVLAGSFFLNFIYKIKVKGFGHAFFLP